MPLLNDVLQKEFARIDKEFTDAHDRVRARRDVNDYYANRRLERKELVIVKYPVITHKDTGLEIVWHTVSFEGRDNANFWIQRHNITGAKVINSLLA